MSVCCSSLPPQISNVFWCELNVCRLCEGGDEEADDKVVVGLRTELWQKELKLTDIRLEALSSAHQLEQLRDAMNNMQVCFACICMSTKVYTENICWSVIAFCVYNFNLKFFPIHVLVDRREPEGGERPFENR